MSTRVKVIWWWKEMQKISKKCIQRVLLIWLNRKVLIQYMKIILNLIWNPVLHSKV